MSKEIQDAGGKHSLSYMSHRVTILCSIGHKSRITSHKCNPLDEETAENADKNHYNSNWFEPNSAYW